MPERQALAQSIPTSSPMQRTECAGSAAEAVAEILSCADIAVGAIGRQAEAQVREMTALAEARPAAEAAERRAHLERLRTDLAERAAALAFSYASILDELSAIDRMLGGEAEAIDAGDQATGTSEDADPRVAAIKMTLKERRRVHVPSDAYQVPPGPWTDPGSGSSAEQQATREIWPAQTAAGWRQPPPPPEPWPPPQAYAPQPQQQPRETDTAPAPPPPAPAPWAEGLPATQPAPAQPEVQPRRRSWRLWQRAA